MLLALWSLSRPRMLPFVLLLPLLGAGWAHWEHRLDLVGLPRLGAVLGAWALLHAGTLWGNAALDRDGADVLFGRAVPVPAAAGPLGVGALLLAVGLAALAGPLAGAAAAGAALLSLLYSHPATAWKGHPLAGPLVNAAGYGLLSPLAGWATVQVPASPVTLAAWPLLAVGLLAPTFAAQAFQGREDAARGYRTLVVTHGPGACLRAARASLLLALAWGCGLAALGAVPRLCLLGAPAWLLTVRWLGRRARDADQGPSLAQGLVLRMVAATAVTVLLAWLDLVGLAPAPAR